MSFKCKKCGEKLSLIEQKDIIEAMEYCDPVIICNECFDMEQYNDPGEDCFSDADPGL